MLNAANALRSVCVKTSVKQWTKARGKPNLLSFEYWTSSNYKVQSLQILFSLHTAISSRMYTHRFGSRLELLTDLSCFRERERNTKVVWFIITRFDLLVTYNDLHLIAYYAVLNMSTTSRRFLLTNWVWTCV